MSGLFLERRFEGAKMARIKDRRSAIRHRRFVFCIRNHPLGGSG